MDQNSTNSCRQDKLAIAETKLAGMYLSLPTILAPQRPAPEVYTVVPPQQREKKPGQLERWQLEQYFDKGFLIVPKFFTKEEMQPVIEVTKDAEWHPL